MRTESRGYVLRMFDDATDPTGERMRDPESPDTPSHPPPADDEADDHRRKGQDPKSDDEDDEPPPRRS